MLANYFFNTHFFGLCSNTIFIVKTSKSNAFDVEKNVRIIIQVLCFYSNRGWKIICFLKAEERKKGPLLIKINARKMCWKVESFYVFEKNKNRKSRFVFDPKWLMFVTFYALFAEKVSRLVDKSQTQRDHRLFGWCYLRTTFWLSEEWEINRKTHSNTRIVSKSWQNIGF